MGKLENESLSWQTGSCMDLKNNAACAIPACVFFFSSTPKGWEERKKKRKENLTKCRRMLYRELFLWYICSYAKKMNKSPDSA